MLRHLAKPLFQATSIARSTTTASKPPSAPSQYTPNDASIRTWLQKVGEISNTPESKSYLGQLTTIVNIFNRKAADSPKDIDWADWSSRIQTEGIVDKIRTNYETLSKEEYRVDDIINNVMKADSGELKQLSLEMDYHTNLWITKYAQYIEWLFNSETVAAHTEYSGDEMYDMFPGLEEWSQSQWETHCYIAGSRDDVNLYGYMRAQFSWGRKVITFYRHPADDNRSFRATKNTLGR